MINSETFIGNKQDIRICCCNHTEANVCSTHTSTVSAIVRISMNSKTFIRHRVAAQTVFNSSPTFEPRFASSFNTVSVMDLEAKPEQILRIPDTMADWPWPREINPHYEEISADSMAWICKFGTFIKSFDVKNVMKKTDACRHTVVSSNHLY